MSSLFTLPFVPALGLTGLPASAATLTFYVSGTTTLATIRNAGGSALANPITADAFGRFADIYLDDTVVYRAVLKTAAGVTLGDVDPVAQTGLAGGSGSSHVGFLPSGIGAITRTAQAKLRDTISAKDFGATGNGTTDDKPALDAAAASLTSGGLIDLPAGTYRVGQQFIGPARGTVHAYDTAIIGTTDVLTNGIFAGSPATGWTLANFTSANPGLSHIAGTEGSAKRTITVAANTTYLIRVTLTTTTLGGIGFYVAGDGLTGSDRITMPVGTDTVEFAFFSSTNTGPIDFELRTNIYWAGSIAGLLVIEVRQEAPYDYFSIASDKPNFDNMFGIKFGRFLSGNIAIGDRQTSSLLSYNAAWNVAIGSRALSTNRDGFENTAVGAIALEYNQVDRNTAGGYSSFRYNTKGIQNTGWGYKTSVLNSTGSNLTSVGFWANYYGKTGNHNSAIGALALYYNEFGNYNTALGSQAGLNNGGDANTDIGALTGPNTNGEYRFNYTYQTCVGNEANAYGDYNTAVGALAKVGGDPRNGGTALTNATAIGARAVATKNNQVRLGDSNVTETSTTGLLLANSSRGVPVGGDPMIGFVATNTANFGVFFGSGAPTLSVAKGSLYLRSDGSSTSTRMYVNTDGGTGWTAVTTVS